MSESQSEKAPDIAPEFDDLAQQLKSIPGVDEIVTVRRDVGGHFLVIILSSGAAAAIGKKALDSAGQMVVEYFKRKKLEVPARSITILDEHGEVISRVQVERQKG